ncbi:hypothetical protein C1646_668007 [Rhizophagus diaphanus]|nr:hypothetical protein C1646_668007 [Rhizophagus diaphanus] [Rhizophagus sp. MUCL 43196]
MVETGQCSPISLDNILYICVEERFPFSSLIENGSEFDPIHFCFIVILVRILWISLAPGLFFQVHYLPQSDEKRSCPLLRCLGFYSEETQARDENLYESKKCKKVETDSHQNFTCPEIQPSKKGIPKLKIPTGQNPETQNPEIQVQNPNRLYLENVCPMRENKPK